MFERYQELINLLNNYNYHYYTLDNPIVSDKEYDCLYDELTTLENLHPDWVADNSPTKRVGGLILDKFEKKEHTTPLYSLDKAQDFERIHKFVNDIHKTVGKSVTFSLEQKLDGLAFILRYENGRLVESRTRGTGKIGELITEQIKTIKSIPLSIPFKDVLEVQGEIFMPIDKFKKFNQKLADDFNSHVERVKETKSLSEEEIETIARKYVPLKNPRNGAAGAVRNLNPKVTASRPLDAFLYNVPYIEGKTFSSQEEMLEFLKSQGLKVNPYFFVLSTPKEIVDKLKEMNDIRPTLNWDIDGMVIKLNDTTKRETVGYTSKFPKWAIAYKFEALEQTTKLLSVSWEVGRTGRMTPLAHLEPVDFDGVTVSKATLNNMDDIHRKGVKIGAEVFVRRSNDVIPEIMGIVDSSEGLDIQPPHNCPECGSVLVEDGAHLFCKNHDSCPAQQIGKIIHFASREAMNIDTFSEKTAEQLWDANLIRNVVDLYKLQKEDLVSLERFGERKAINLLEAIENSKRVKLEAFIFSLGIRHVGKGTVERLLRHYSSLSEIQNASISDLILIEDIGEAVAQSIFDFFREEKNVELISELLNVGVSPFFEKPQTSSNSFEGMTFVITGSMPSGKSRKDIEKFIKENGGKTSGSISKNTTYLVAGEDAGSKLEKAQKFQVSENRKIIITEDELYNMI